MRKDILTMQGYDPKSNHISVKEHYPNSNNAYAHLESHRVIFDKRGYDVLIKINGEEVLIPSLHNLIAALCQLRDAKP